MRRATTPLGEGGGGQVLEAAVNKAGSLDKDVLREVLSALAVTTVFGRYQVDATGRQLGKSGYNI